MCPCAGGGEGTQACQSDGTFGACRCPDAGSDAGVDAQAPDAPIADAAPVDVTAVDVARDEAALDAAPDVASPDATFDVTPDVAPADAIASDVTLDDATDVGTDTATATDAAADAVADAIAPMDAADVTPPDVTAFDAAADAAPADAAADAAPADVTLPDADATGACAAGAVVELATAGTRAANVTRYAGSNRAAIVRSSLGQPCGRASSPVVHRYVPRANARLTISTQNVGTDTNFDTVLFAMDACSAPTYGGSTLFGCNDDAGGSFLGAASTITIARAAAGVPIYVAVGGVASSVGTRSSVGEYVLTVNEAPVVGVGASCDRAGLVSACDTGAACSDADPPVCLANGTLGARCRAQRDPCDAPLGCGSDARCRAALPVGSSCTSTSASVCALDALCTTFGTSTCVRQGTRGGYCFSDGLGDRCNSGLVCGPGSFCVGEVPPGGACDGPGLRDVCAAGTTCVSGRCAADGTLNASPRTQLGAVRCDPPLALIEGTARCIAGVPAGSSCMTALCAVGTWCAFVSVTPICYADGARYGYCRRARTLSRCDAGLSCSGDGICLSTLASGEPCGGSTEGVCAPGTSCSSVGGVARCQPTTYVESALASPAYVDACAVGHAESFRDVAGGPTALPLGLPFAFRYFGVDQPAFWPTENGWGIFADPLPTSSVTNVLYTNLFGNIVAPYVVYTYWHDVVTVRESGSRICSATVGAAPARRFVVEWNDFTIGRNNPGVHLTFEVALHETTGDIDFLYRRLEPTSGLEAAAADGTLADIGIRGPAGLPPIVHLGAVSTTTGIRFTPR